MPHMQAIETMTIADLERWCQKNGGAVSVVLQEAEAERPAEGRTP